MAASAGGSAACRADPRSAFKILDIEYTYSDAKGFGMVTMHGQYATNDAKTTSPFSNEHKVRITCTSWMPYFYLSTKHWDRNGVLASLKKCASLSENPSKFSIDSKDTVIHDGYGYSKEKSTFFKVQIANPKLKKDFLDRVVKERQSFHDGDVSSAREILRMSAYMGTVDPVVQIILDTKMYSSAFCVKLVSPYPKPVDIPELDAGTSGVVCFHISSLTPTSIVPAPEVSEFIPRLRVMSLDIECMSATLGTFPKATNAGDHIIQIATVTVEDAVKATDLSHYTDANLSAHASVHVFTLGSCSPLRTGGVVHACDTEAELLLEFARHVRSVDPDVLTGYNIVGFDIPYILDRMHLFGISNVLGRRGTARWSYYTTYEESADDEKKKKEEESDQEEDEDIMFPSKRQLDAPPVTTAAKKAKTTASAPGKIVARAAAGSGGGGGWAKKQTYIITPGRIVIDMYSVMRDSKKLDSYTLNAVSKAILKEEKDDVNYREISRLQKLGGPDGRKKIADYCVQDTVLPLKLMAVTYTMTGALEMNRISHVPMRYVYGRGQQIRVFTSVLVESEMQGGYLYPSFNYIPKAFRQDDTYQGATVIPPKIGFYSNPVITLDFESLYPSTMRTGNFCITTWIWKEDEKDLCVDDNGFTLNAEAMRSMDRSEECLGKQHDDDPHVRKNWAATARAGSAPKSKKQMADEKALSDYEEFLSCIKANKAWLRQGVPSKNGDCFVTSQTRQGVMPCMLGKLIEARRAVKRQMATEKDPVKKIVLNERQNSLKVLANSVYGFCGVSPKSGYALLPCQPVSRSVTAMGRTLIAATIYHTLAHSNANGLGLRVIYGDTDSVMILTKLNSLQDAENLGSELSERITDKFPGVIRLCYEKTYMPYLLLAKKRYVGGHYTNGKFNKLDFKGIEIVRRDTCKYVSYAIKSIIEKLMSSSSVLQSLNCAHDILSRLEGAPISEFVMSKSLNSTAPTLPHYQVAMRIKERGETTEPQQGERVPFIVCSINTNPAVPKNPVSKRICDRVEDPDFVKKQGLPVDYPYYTEMVTASLSRLFKVMLFNNVSGNECDDISRILHPFLSALGISSKVDVADEDAMKIAQLVLEKFVVTTAEAKTHTQRSFQARMKIARKKKAERLMKESMMQYLLRK